MHVIYLHGFASSARSSKAAFFAARLAEHSIELHTPDLNDPDFSTLTISRMVDRVVADIDELPGGPVALIGSSLGGFVAVQTALKRPSRVDRLALLAPALDFGANRMREFGDRALEEWERTGRLNIFHYAYGRMASVHYELYADACCYDCFNAAVPIPVQIFQGRRDAAVDPATVERWAQVRHNVELHLLDDDHQLLGSLNDIWREMQPFLLSSSAARSPSNVAITQSDPT